MSQKTEIKFEVEETVVLKQGGKILRDYCPQCGLIVDMVSPDVLALVMSASEREIFRLVERGVIHFIEAERLIVCPSCYSRAIAMKAADIVAPSEVVELTNGTDLKFSGAA